MERRDKLNLHLTLNGGLPVNTSSAVLAPCWSVHTGAGCARPDQGATLARPFAAEPAVSMPQRAANMERVVGWGPATSVGAVSSSRRRVINGVPCMDNRTTGAERWQR